jgi:hypothetical protein
VDDGEQCAIAEQVPSGRSVSMECTSRGGERLAAASRGLRKRTAVRRNVVRLIRAPMLCPCKRAGEEGNGLITAVSPSKFSVTRSSRIEPSEGVHRAPRPPRITPPDSLLICHNLVLVAHGSGVLGLTWSVDSSLRRGVEGRVAGSSVCGYR